MTIRYDGALKGKGVVKKMAAKLSRAEVTIYDYLSGRTQPPFLDFLHAAVIATDGHAEIRKYLEPEQFELNHKVESMHSTKDTESEAMDVVIAISKFIESFRIASKDKKYTPAEIKELLGQVEFTKRQLLEMKRSLLDEIEKKSRKLKITKFRQTKTG
ncbi:MAG: hypothetical protein GY874_14210, partial [Desulfobacteraceae bacterium]|nr:hypothetical protein [Desulfobacteraceae bacterium]